MQRDHGGVQAGEGEPAEHELGAVVRRQHPLAHRDARRAHSWRSEATIATASP